jgi:hypothetical protein
LTRIYVIIFRNLQILISGVKKCDLQLNEDQLKDVSVVLEECGSEVEDDDVLKEYKDKIFMLMMPGEKWHDVKEDDKQLNNSAAELENTLANTPVVDLISFCV